MAYGVAPHIMGSPPIYYNKVINKLLMNMRHRAVMCFDLIVLSKLLVNYRTRHYILAAALIFRSAVVVQLTLYIEPNIHRFRTKHANTNFNQYATRIFCFLLVIPEWLRNSASTHFHSFKLPSSVYRAHLSFFAFPELISCWVKAVMRKVLN